MEVDPPATSSRSRSSSPTRRQFSSKRGWHRATAQTDERMEIDPNVFGMEFMRNTTMQSPPVSPPTNRAYCPGGTSPPYVDDQGISPGGPMVPEVRELCYQFMDSRFDPLGVRPLMAPLNQPIFQQLRFPIQQPQLPIQQPQFPIQPPQLPIQQPQFPIQQPQALVQQPQALVQQPQALVQQPQALVQQPQALVQQPQALVQQPQALVQQPQALIQDDGISSLNRAAHEVANVTYVRSSFQRMTSVPYELFNISTDDEWSDESGSRDPLNENINLSSDNSFSLSPTQFNECLQSSSRQSNRQSSPQRSICEPTEPPRVDVRNLPPAARPKLVARRRLRK